MSAASVRLIKTCYMFHLGAGDEKAGILQSRSLGFSTAAAECLRVVLWTGWRVWILLCTIQTIPMHSSESDFLHSLLGWLTGFTSET